MDGGRGRAARANRYLFNIGFPPCAANSLGLCIPAHLATILGRGRDVKGGDGSGYCAASSVAKSFDGDSRHRVNKERGGGTRPGPRNQGRTPETHVNPD